MRTQGTARSAGRRGHALPLSGGASAFNWRTLGVTRQDQRIPGFLVTLVRCVVGRKCWWVRGGGRGKTEISAEIEKGCDLSVSPCGWVCGHVCIPLTVCPLPGTCPALPGACDPFNPAEAVPCGVWGVRTCRCLTS